MTKLEKNMLYLIAFVIFGIMASVQIRSENDRSKLKNASGVYSRLVQSLEDEKKLGENLKKGISECVSNRDSIITAKSDLANDNLLKELNRAKLIAGFVDVRGKGIILTLKDSKKKNVNPDYSVVHDTDVLKILNEMRRGGAQALSVNDERIMSVSEIVCAGPTVKVNKTRYAVPFEIKAIGKPEYLYNLLAGSGIVKELKSFSISVDVKKSDNILIPGFKGVAEKYVTGLEVVEK